MVDILNKQELESMFSEDFNSPIFPYLADMYFLEGDIRRARLVCEVGLKNNVANTDGRYILAKVELHDKKLLLAEKLLKQVVFENPVHINALRKFGITDFHRKTFLSKIIPLR